MGRITASSANSTPRQSKDVGPWQRHAVELAEFVMAHMINRHDAWGQYSPVSVRKEKGSHFWVKDAEISLEMLARHFRASSNRGHVMGLATTVRDEGESPECWSRWGAVDLDLHEGDEGKVDAGKNCEAALAFAKRVSECGLDALVEDSNGMGGFHVWIIFNRPVPTPIVFAFLKWLIRDWQALGLCKEPEVFPKQAEIGEEEFGNWLRLPGLHHTRDHRSRFYDGERWLEGNDACLFFLSYTPVDPDLIPREARESLGPVSRPDPRPPLQGVNGQVKAHATGKAGPWLVTPWDDLKARVDWAAIMTKAGGSPVKGKPRQWTRPGKPDGPSAQVDWNGLDRLKVFTDNWPPFSHTRTYSKLEAWALVEYGIGDFDEACCKAFEQGYGKRNGEVTSGQKPRRKANLICFTDIQEKPVEWLWYPRLPLGMNSLFAGSPKVGKTFVSIAIAAAVSRGAPLPLDDPRAPGSVIILSAEDDPANTLKPRLRTAGANMSKVHFLRSVLLEDGSEALPGLRADLEAIEDAARGLEDCRLIIIDPISAYLNGIDDHKNAEIRGLLFPLNAMAGRLKAAILLITHLNKSSAQDAQQRVTGSVAYVAACRANFLFTRDKDDPAKRRRLMLDNGCNLTEEVPTLAYRIADSGEGSQVEWEQDPVPISTEEAMTEDPPGDREDPFEARECDEWLMEALGSGPKPHKDLIREGKDNGSRKGCSSSPRNALRPGRNAAGLAREASLNGTCRECLRRP
jgi:hypothetical protein